jgi:eukaryotic-like serine/threonine-protein kinase
MAYVSAYPSSLRQGGEGIAPGTRLGPYEILARLGAGGMASVWLARAVRHERFERLVALKTVHPHLSADDRSRQLFLREAEIAATIHHANVVDVFDVGEADGIPYQVMTLVEGSDLRGLTDRFGAPLPAGVLTSIVLDALRGLHAAHESTGSDGRPRLVVHRDVSPQNILVGLDGVARVSDFGIARILTSTEDTTTSLRGKFTYFSPEQASRGPVDRRTDVFAMGIVLWEGLTGERLFRGSDALECLQLVTGKPIVHPSMIREGAPRELGDVALKALSRDPEGRFATAAVMASALVSAARAAGLAVSSDEVARFVEAVVGPEVRQRVRAASSHAERAGTTSLADAAHAGSPALDDRASGGTASYVTAAPAASVSVGESRPLLTGPPPARAHAPSAEATRSGPKRGWLAVAIAVLALGGAISIFALARGGAEPREAVHDLPQAPQPIATAMAIAPAETPAPAAPALPPAPEEETLAPTAAPATSAAPARRTAPPRRRAGKKATAGAAASDPPYIENPFKN